ncbi:MAG: hypothetical protein JW829_15900 [Pirellulales bacterium]|nr:hypothetical protein [Pirellulales bacterium]
MSLGTRDRRRRILSEEVRGASVDTQQPTIAPPAEGSRYTDAASIENHPQITDFIPRRFRSYVILIGIGGGIISALVVLQLRADQIAAILGIGPIENVHLDSISRLGAWFSSVLLLGTSLVAWLVYTLRRHRINDYRARYRIWIGLSGTCLLLSINMTAGLHIPWSRAMSSLTGWTAFQDDSVWWIAPVALIVTWIGFRIAPDLVESRVAILAFLAATACYTLTIVQHAGWMGHGLSEMSFLCLTSAALFGHLFLFLAVTSYARYLVLDVQGLVQHPNCKATRKANRQSIPNKKLDLSDLPNSSDDCLANARASGKSRRTDLSDRNPAAVPGRSKSGNRKEQVSKSTEWVDGSEPEQNTYDDDPPRTRHLSKTERKRLRKLKEKARQRAA